MKKIKLIFALLVIAVCNLTSSSSFAAPVYGYVKIGHGNCTSNCVCAFTATTALPPSPTPDGIPATFAKDPSNAAYILITFKMSDLQTYQPDQAIAIYNATLPGQDNVPYNFTQNYSLTQPMYLPLGLESGSYIGTSSSITVTTAGDMVTIRAQYFHN